MKNYVVFLTSLQHSIRHSHQKETLKFGKFAEF